MNSQGKNNGLAYACHGSYVLSRLHTSKTSYYCCQLYDPLKKVKKRCPFFVSTFVNLSLSLITLLHIYTYLQYRKKIENRTVTDHYYIQAFIINHTLKYA